MASQPDNPNLYSPAARQTSRIFVLGRTPDSDKLSATLWHGHLPGNDAKVRTLALSFDAGVSGVSVPPGRYPKNDPDKKLLSRDIAEALERYIFKYIKNPSAVSVSHIRHKSEPVSLLISTAGSFNEEMLADYRKTVEDGLKRMEEIGVDAFILENPPEQPGSWQARTKPAIPDRASLEEKLFAVRNASGKPDIRAIKDAALIELATGLHAKMSQRSDPPG